MDDKEFERQAANVLTWIDTALEASGVDVDVEQVASGVVELVFADDSKMIVNRHAAAREIWVAARSGGFHFRVADGAWRDTRSGETLTAALARLVAEQAGEALSPENLGAPPL